MPMANLGFSTRASSQKVSTSDYTTGTITDSIEIPTASPGFSTMASPNKRRQVTATMTDNRKQQYVYVLGANLAILLVDRCRNHLANLLSSSSSSKIPNLALKFRRYLSEFQRCNCFQFWEPYRYLRFSVIVTCQHYIFHLYMVLHSGFVVGIITVPFVVSETQAFPVSAAISDCRSLWESSRYTSCEFAMVECRRFAVGISMICFLVSEILLLVVS